MRIQPTAITNASEARKQRLPSGLPPLVLFGGYGAFCVVPLILAVIQGHPARNILHELSSAIVMVAFVMTLLQFVLSGRFEWLSGRIGIDRTMRFHQVVSWSILSVICLHPFLYVVPRLFPDPTDALSALNQMLRSQALRTGVVAWWLMIFLVLLAVFRDRLAFRYELWRMSHGMLAIAIAMLGAHHTLRVGTYSAAPWLATFWIGGTTVAVLAMLHVYILKPLRKLRQAYRVVSNRQVADRMWEIAVEPEGRPAMEFAPGQFVWLNLGHSAFSLTEHPFSISSAPVDQPRIAFIIKANGDFTNEIGTIGVGTRAFLDGPHGNFTLAGREAKGLVFLAGGVGFAPIIGMLRQLKAERYPHPLRLLYGNRVETQILYQDEIEAFKEVLDFEVFYVLSEPSRGWTGLVGELSRQLVNTCLDSFGDTEWLFFICGPPPMQNSVERTIIDRGVPLSRIVSERFKYN
jgi:predicted ferric reductase